MEGAGRTAAQRPGVASRRVVGPLVVLVVLAPAALASDVFVDGRPVESKADGPCVDLLTNQAKRYVDCGNGTVWDLHTGLLWLQDASCGSLGPNGDGLGNWLEAQAAVAAIAHGLDCDGDGTPDLTDHSQPGDWRLARAEEWRRTVYRAVDLGCVLGGLGSPPSLTDDAGGDCMIGGEGTSFLGVTTDFHWSADSDSLSPHTAVDARLLTGVVDSFDKIVFDDVIWPVRRGGSYAQRGGLVIDGGVAEALAGDPCEAPVTTGSQRYINCGDGTIWDLALDLIWLRNASCEELAGVDSLGEAQWAEAMTAAAMLGDGSCGLADGSQPGDWRLPTQGEWQGAIAHAADIGCTEGGARSHPSLTNRTGDDCVASGPNPFVGLLGPDYVYWSSTTSDLATAGAYAVQLKHGHVGTNFAKTNHLAVWPVRERRWPSPR